MFLASIAGYLVAVLFAFCGIVNLATFLSEPEAITNHSDFTTGLVQAAWPLAVAVAVCLLTEIAGLLTKQSIMLSSLKQDEATEKQEDKLFQAQEAFENVISIRDSMQEMIKFKGK